MKFENVSILSVAHVDAPNRMSSEDIERRLAPTLQRLGMRSDLLRDLSGIIERRYWDEGAMPSEAATKAGQKALDAAGIERSNIGILINTSVCRDYLEPSTACIVHSSLDLPETCRNFDLSNACLGFVSGMEMVGSMIERGEVDYAILVDGETSRQITETTIEFLSGGEVDQPTFRENFASLTLGSGAAAMVLGRSDLAPEGHAFKGSVNLAATQHCRLCAGNVDHMVTRTKELLVAGMELALRTWGNAAKVLDWTADTIDHFVFHQVSKVHTEQLAGLLGIDLRKVFRIYPDFGNIGPAGVPIVLSKIQEAGKLESGQRIALLGIGSGLNCTMAEVVW